MKKKVSQWLSEYLSSENLALALENNRENNISDFRLNLETNNPMRALSIAFVWQQSKQGHEYWSNVRNEIHDHWIREHRNKSLLSSDELINKHYPDKSDSLFEMYQELTKLVNKDVDPSDMDNILEVYEGLDDPKIKSDYNETLIRVLRRTLEEVGN